MILIVPNKLNLKMRVKSVKEKKSIAFGFSSSKLIEVL